MSSLAAFIVLCVLSTGCDATQDTPPVVLYQNVSNVYGRAFVNVSKGVVMYLGRFDTPAKCEAACLKFKGADGSVCNSFSHHAANFPQPDYKGACYAITDHSWSPVYNSALLTSGKVGWPNPKCGGSSPGCEWEMDPVELATYSPTHTTNIIAKGSMTTDEALAACAQRSDCLGVTAQSKVANSTVAIPTLLMNTTDEVHGGGSGSWSYRKSYPLAADPYRTGFHFQPTGQWMNDPNAPMFYNGLYHLFFQWNPFANVGFSDMHWGHAVSKDMLGWKQLPIALAPDRSSCGGEWSGSATLNAPANPTGPTLSYSVQCNSYFGQALPAAVDPKTDPLLLNWTANHKVGSKDRLLLCTHYALTMHSLC
jgi:hypothetical protein